MEGGGGGWSFKEGLGIKMHRKNHSYYNPMFDTMMILIHACGLSKKHAGYVHVAGIRGAL